MTYISKDDYADLMSKQAQFAEAAHCCPGDRGQIIQLTFAVKAISKDNEKIFNRQGRPFTSGKYKLWERNIALLAKAQYAGKPLQGDIEVFICFSFADKRHCDLSNLFKSVFDSLQGIVYKNDKQIKRLTASLVYGKEEITVKIRGIK